MTGRKRRSDMEWTAHGVANAASDIFYGIGTNARTSQTCDLALARDFGRTRSRSMTLRLFMLFARVSPVRPALGAGWRPSQGLLEPGT